MKGFGISAFVCALAGMGCYGLSTEDKSVSKSDTSSNGDRASEGDETSNGDTVSTEPSDSESENGADSIPVSPAAPTFVAIEPGSFMMGSPESEWGRDENEYLHEVTHLHRYEIATTEVTCGQWKAYPTGYENRCEPDENAEVTSTCTDDDCPVASGIKEIQVWLDALSVDAGLSPCYAEGAVWPTPMHCPGYRLPTESEWERATRAGDGRATYNGDFTFGCDPNIIEIWMPEVLKSIAWCGKPGIAQVDRKPRAVAMGAPNAFGLYDTLGNVAELTVWEGIYSSDAQDGVYGDVGGDLAALRGGSFDSFASEFHNCRAASRTAMYVDAISGGFRPVRTLPDSALPDPASNDACRSEVPDEFCPLASPTPPPLLHAASDGVRFVDMSKPYNCHEIVLLGEDAAMGPFLEIYDYSRDIEITDYFPTEPMASGSARAVASVEDNYEDSARCRVAAVLCEEERCVLYELSSREDPNAALVPMANGEIPPELGQEVNLVIQIEPLRILVAGNGIASFDGETWRQEAAPDTGGLLLSIRATALSETDTYAVASGRAGRLLYSNGAGEWRALATGTNADLTDALLYSDRNGRISVTAVGTGGAFVDGPVDALVSCRVGDRDIIQVLGEPSGISDYSLFTADDARIRRSDLQSGLRNCRMNPPPEGMLKAGLFDCYFAKNEVYLSEDGLYGEGIRCPVE